MVLVPALTSMQVVVVVAAAMPKNLIRTLPVLPHRSLSLLVLVVLEAPEMQMVPLVPTRLLLV